MIKHNKKLPIEIVPKGIKLFIRLAPKAKREQIAAIVDRVDGKQALKVSVTAIPEKGKANLALIKLLAKKLKIAKSCFEIILGETDKNKTVLIHSNDTDETYSKIRDLFVELDLL